MSQQRVLPFLRSLFGGRGDLPFLAMAAVQVWALYPRKTFNEAALFALPAQVESVIFGEVEALTALAVALFVMLRRPPRARGIDVIPPAVFAALGLVPLAVALGAGRLGTIVDVLIAATSGFTKTWLVMLCASMYCRMDVRRAVSYTLLSYALAALVRMPLELLPLWAVCLVSAPFPCICARMCRAGIARLDREGPEESSLGHGATTSLSFPSYLIILTTFSFALGSFWMIVEPHMGVVPSVLMVLVQALVPLGFLALLLRTYQTINLGFIFQLILMLVMVAALFTTSTGMPGYGDVAPTAAYLSRFFLKMMTVTVLIVLSKQSRLHPMTLFGLGYGAFLAALTTGIAVRYGVHGDLPATTSTLFVLLLLVVAMTAVLAVNMYRERDSRLFPVYRPSDEPPTRRTSLSRQDLVLARCDAIAGEVALTPRETEVMKLIGLGHSKGYIAEDLGLSENTIRGYAKSLYRKLSIHSRQELLDLIDQA